MGFKVTAKLTGAPELKAVLRRRYAQAKDDAGRSVAIGYSAPYAMAVHENLEVHHDNGQAKFIEKPVREMRSELQKQIDTDIKAGVKPKVAFMKAGRKLLAASQKLVPVDTGKLKASGFVILQ